VIEIRAELCSGCGTCVEVCPTGALYLVEGKAVVDEALCRECQACVSACPSNAIIRNTDVYPHVVDEPRVAVSQTTAEIVRVQPPIVPAPRGLRVLPWLGLALAWAGREIVPRLAEHVLYDLDRRMASWQATDVQESAPDADPVVRGGGGGNRHRRRRGG